MPLHDEIEEGWPKDMRKATLGYEEAEWNPIEILALRRLEKSLFHMVCIYPV